jgi:hypothetical protein
VHTIPDRGIAFTVGNLTPVADFPECGGSGGLAESDVKVFHQEVITPAGPIKLLDRIKGTFVVYDAVLPRRTTSASSLRPRSLGVVGGVSQAEHCSTSSAGYSSMV